MTSETQCCDNVVTTLPDIATKIQPKLNVATMSCASWAFLTIVIMYDSENADGLLPKNVSLQKKRKSS